jgi:hypothetical protein
MIPMMNIIAWGKDTFRRVFLGLIVLLPGEPWAKTEDMKERLGIL